MMILKVSFHLSNIIRNLHLPLCRTVTNLSVCKNSLADVIIKHYSSQNTSDDGLKVTVIGSGNWGTTVARLIGNNVENLQEFNKQVKMYVHEEIYNGKKLTEIINETHINVKYLPGFILPKNVIAVPDVVESARDADFIVFVTPQVFVHDICTKLADNVKPDAVALTLIKGFARPDGGGMQLTSQIIRSNLNIDVCVLMGANIAVEVADGYFCEATIGCKDQKIGSTLKRMIQTDFLRVTVIDDVPTIECCGALKNIVACATGFVDGLGLKSNSKAATIRLGFIEMIAFIKILYPESKLSTFLESCGMADLITTCYGGRNRRITEAMVITGKSLSELEEKMLNGQKLEGPRVAKEVYITLKKINKEAEFPIFVAVHKIFTGEIKAGQLVDAMKSHPAHY